MILGIIKKENMCIKVVVIFDTGLRPPNDSEIDADYCLAEFYGLWGKYHHTSLIIDNCSVHSSNNYVLWQL